MDQLSSSWLPQTLERVLWTGDPAQSLGQSVLRTLPQVKLVNLGYSRYFNIDRFISDPHQTLHVHKGQKLVAMQIFDQSKGLLEDEIRPPLDGRGLHFLLSTGNISYIMHL